MLATPPRQHHLLQQVTSSSLPAGPRCFALAMCLTTDCCCCCCCFLPPLCVSSSSSGLRRVPIFCCSPRRCIVTYSAYPPRHLLPKTPTPLHCHRRRFCFARRISRLLTPAPAVARPSTDNITSILARDAGGARLPRVRQAFYPPPPSPPPRLSNTASMTVPAPTVTFAFAPRTVSFTASPGRPSLPDGYDCVSPFRYRRHLMSAFPLLFGAHFWHKAQNGLYGGSTQPGKPSPTANGYTVLFFLLDDHLESIRLMLAPLKEVCNGS